MALAEDCYRLTKDFPHSEVFGMTAQIRRAAASIAANVAEGYGREHTRPFIQSLRISQGSLKELETHLLLARRVGLSDESETNPLLDRCEKLGKMLRALNRSLQSRNEEQKQ
jgi:four helix bundle protein